jgi:sn-glycerol 3-phosphate transport system substrate-binding protein
MMERRFFVLAVVLGLVLSCDRGSDEPKPGGDEVAPVEVTFWYAYGGKNREVTEALIERFNKSHPKIRVKGTYQGDYFEALAKIRLASRTSLGPVVTHVIGESLPSLWESGILQDMTAYASGERGTALDLDDFIPALTQDGYFDYGGKDVPLFALPFNRSTPICYYNVRMFEEAGLSPPETWEELRSHAQKLTKRDGDKTLVWGFELPVDWWFWYGLLHQAGGTLLSDDFTKSSFGGAEGKAALRLLIGMVKEDKTMRHPPGRDYNAWEIANTDFLNEKVAMIWTSTAFLAFFQENAKFKFRTAFLPGNQKKAVPTGGTFFVMMKKVGDEKKRAGWEFLRWMSQPSQTAYWARNTGYMPVRKSALESEELRDFYKGNPDYRTAIDQLQHAVKFPFSPDLLEIQRKILQPNLEAPVVGRATVDEVMDKAAREADRVLSR